MVSRIVSAWGGVDDFQTTGAWSWNGGIEIEPQVNLKVVKVYVGSSVTATPITLYGPFYTTNYQGSKSIMASAAVVNGVAIFKDPPLLIKGEKYALLTDQNNNHSYNNSNALGYGEIDNNVKWVRGYNCITGGFDTSNNGYDIAKIEYEFVEGPGGKGTKAINKNYPSTSGLTAGTTKQEGRTMNLIYQDSSNVQSYEIIGF